MIGDLAYYADLLSTSTRQKFNFAFRQDSQNRKIFVLHDSLNFYKIPENVGQYNTHCFTKNYERIL